MGLLGGKKTEVSSVVYNMAGPEVDRIQYLKTVVAGAFLTDGRNFSIADVLSRSYMNGPGMQVRKFHRWARTGTNYAIGVPTMRIKRSFGNTTTDIATYLPAETGVTFDVVNVKYSSLDWDYWVDQYILENMPDRFANDYTSFFNEMTDEMTIQFAEGTPEFVTFMPANFDREAHYFYITYNRKSGTTDLGPRMFIYKIGDGIPELDALQQEEVYTGDFVAYIPVREFTKFLSPTFRGGRYYEAKRAYKKATGQKIDKLIEKIAENDSIDDIDFTYMMYGVSLNTNENAAKKYLFKFFDLLRDAQGYESSYFGSWAASQAAYHEDMAAWRAGRFDGFDPEDPDSWNSPRDSGYIPPPTPPTPIKPVTEVQFHSASDEDGMLRMSLLWDDISKTSGTGRRIPGAKKGMVWWQSVNHRLDENGLMVFNSHVIGSFTPGADVTIVWQITDDYWEAITLKGFYHKNLIYNGQAVNIDAIEALADDEESGFIVPLHYDTLRSLSLVDSTQMMTAGTYLVFNCYTVVKTKWYQSIAFKIFVFIVIIAVTVATMGAAAPGLLGTAGSVGAALGFTGVVATIVGAIVNAIAAMLLSQLLMMGATKVFGAKIGMIIGTIAAAFAMQIGTGLMSGMSLAQSWGSMMSAVNLIQLTSAVGNGVAGYMQASVMDIQGKMKSMMDDYNEKAKLYEEMYLKEFGNGQFAFDPLQLTNYNVEPPQMFLDRTLLTGSDIAEMSFDMLSNFAEYTTSLNTMAS